MTSAEGWVQLRYDADANVRVLTVTADTHEEIGQELLTDPLTFLRRGGLCGNDEDEGKDEWVVQLQVVNAQIPSGPLPLPDEILSAGGESGWGWPLPPWVIRKFIFFLLIFEDLKLVVIVGRRFDTDRSTALEHLERSRAAGRGQA
jgi:hypothetical protein